MQDQSIPLSDLATPAEYAAFHGLSIHSTYRLIAAGRLQVVNVPPGMRPTYRLAIEQFPQAVQRTPSEARV